MVSRRRTIVVRRRGTGRNIFSSIIQAFSSSARRPLGIILLAFTVLLTLNYSANAEDNWITKAATKISGNKVWKWLGEYITKHVLQVLHCFWLTTAAFLATRPELALLVSLIMSALTLYLNATTNTDIALQSTFIYIFLATRNNLLRIIAVVLLIIAIVLGHTFKQYGA